MKKKYIKDLVKQSYVNDVLDQERVEEIASTLKRSELNIYIRALKNEQKKKTVFVSSSVPLGNDDQQKIQSEYPTKSITYEADPSLLIGIRVVANDIIMDCSLKDSLEQICKAAQNI